MCIIFFSGYWIPSSMPVITEEGDLKLHSSTQVENKRRMQFIVTGNDYYNKVILKKNIEQQT